MQESRAPAVRCVEVNRGMLHLHTHTPRVSLCAEQANAEQQVVLCLGKRAPHISDSEACDLS